MIAQVAGLFTAPALAALGAAAVSIPIIIHLMSRFRRRPEAWGAMRFLIEAYRKQRKRLQIEKLLLLVVRCMVVLLAGLALAGPILSGCSQGGMTFGGGGGRIVYIVIDDALSSQTREAGTTRLESFKQEATKVIDEMNAEDRAVIVRMARPTGAIDQPTSDKDALRDAIDAIEPRYSRGELIDALSLVQQSIDRNGVRDGEAFVVLLSDFPASADYFEQPIPPELEGLGERATIVTALPPTGTDNVQVMSLTPRRRMVVAESTGSTIVSGRVKLRRFGGIGQPRTVALRIAVQSAEGQALTETQRDVKWPAGEREQGANFDLPVSLPADQVSGAGRELVVVAELVPDAQAAGIDALSADDRAAVVVRLRSQLQIALVDDEADVNPNAGELEPWQWVRAALTPRGAGAGGSFELTPVLPTTLNADSLEPYDAAVVLRPDEVTTRGWEALKGFADRGGLVWVFTPALDTEPDWAEAMKRVFGLPWEFGESVVRYEPAEGSDQRAASVDETTAPPEQLQYLSDWREKLGWVSVSAWLPVWTEDEERWIQLETLDPALPQRAMPVLMAQRQVGQGALVFSAAPLDTRYTNLPIRALFVPLMHDTLRGVLGNTAGEPPLVAGDRPELGRSWRGVGEIERQSTGDDDTTGATLLVQSEGDTAALRDPAEVPGVYRGQVAGSPRLLTVNPDADAGDTLGGQGALEKLLDALGGWAYLNKKQEQGGVLTEAAKRADLTWPLLWALLGLVLLETLLARWFSHATDRDTPTIVGRVLGALHGKDNTPSQTAGGQA
jgi:hypothetical protein